MVVTKRVDCNNIFERKKTVYNSLKRMFASVCFIM